MNVRPVAGIPVVAVGVGVAVSTPSTNGVTVATPALEPTSGVIVATTVLVADAVVAVAADAAVAAVVGAAVGATGTGVFVRVGVFGGTGVFVRVGVFEGTGVFVRVGVFEGTGVFVAVLVGDGVGELVGLDGRGRVKVAVAWRNGTAARRASLTSGGMLTNETAAIIKTNKPTPYHSITGLGCFMALLHGSLRQSCRQVNWDAYLRQVYVKTRGLSSRKFSPLSIQINRSTIPPKFSSPHIWHKE